jgi:ATP-binding cassette subfamily C protein CydC
MISISTFILYGLFSWYAAFVLIIGLLFAGIGIPLLSAKLRKGLGEKLVLLRSEMNILAIDSIQGLADLLVFNQADDYFSHLKAISKQYVNIQRKNMLIESLQGALSVLTLNLTIVGTLLILIPRVSSGALDAVYLSVLVLGVIAVFEAVLPIPEAIQNLEKSLKSADRIFEVIAPQKQEKQPPAYNFLREKFDIRVEGLSFCYDKNQGMVLDDIDLDLSMGRKVAMAL